MFVAQLCSDISKEEGMILLNFMPIDCDLRN